MRPHPLLAAAAVLVTLAVGCSSNKVLVPPRLDLNRYGTLGMIQFSSKERAELGPDASREFLATIQSAQPGTPVLELGAEEGVLGAVQRPTLDVEAVQAIGKKYRVDALVVGVLEMKDVRPNLSVGSGIGLSASADVEGSLSTRILDTKTGATIWTSAASGRAPIARVDVRGGGISGGGTPDAAHARGKLVHDLVGRATADFWPHWVSQ